MITLWNTLLIEPIYNGLIFFINTFPGHSLGIAVIIMTLIVKFILFPIANRSIRTQAAQKKLQPEIKALQEKYKDNKEELSKKMLALYKERKVNPFSGCLLLLIQFPIIIALYSVIIKGVDLKPDLLYSVLQYPQHINTLFLGLFELTEKSIPLALFAGAAQFLQMSLSPALRQGKEEKKNSENTQPMEQAVAMMQKNMRYFMPLMIVLFGWALPGAVTLYWITSALFLTIQEYFIYKTLNVQKHDNINHTSDTQKDIGSS